MDNGEILRAEIPTKFECFREYLETNTRHVLALNLTGALPERKTAFPLSATTQPTGSRIVGPAFISEAFPWPINPEDSQPLCFIAQLNLAQLPPLDGYPHSGLLQFFHIPGCEASTENNCVVRLVPESEFERGHLEQEPEPQSFTLSKGYFEVQGQYYDQFPTNNDYRLPEIPDPNHMDGDEPIDVEDISLELLNLNPTDHIFGAGWASFIFADPRYYPENGITGWELLFQVYPLYDPVSKAELELGDAGVINFFIHPEDRRNQDFSRVRCHVDCH
ncbi:MAG: YwqG family protein [Corynebacterium sp.]|nr:YwqG family protein [Corynebacterium sp.]